MIRSTLWAVAILSAVLVVQATLLTYVQVLGVKPEILFLVFVIIAIQNGSFLGQIIGFLVGLVFDFVSSSTLGFHALQFTLAGYIFGLGSGKVYFDPFIVPAILAFFVTLYQAVSGIAINFAFHLGEPPEYFVNLGTVFQLVLNIVVSPVVFWLYGWFKTRFQDPRRGFGN